MTKFGKTVIWVVLIILVLGAVLMFYMNSKNSKAVAATSYEECVAQGNPSMESYPAQCIDKLGNHFTQVIATSTTATTTNKFSDLIKVTSPKNNGTVTIPLVVKGEARGGWFFEASFPVKLLDGNGNVLGQTAAHADADWMTSDFVPFSATITATSSYTGNGTLILHNDNPSGMPENDKSIEIPVVIN